MSEQVAVEPFIYFIERFRAAMVALLQGILPPDYLLESVDKIIWHALRENKQDYTSIVLQAVFQTIGVSQEQKNRFIRHAGWANHMWNVNGTYHNFHEVVKFPPTKPIYQSNSWHQRREDSLENWTRPCAVQHNNIEQRQSVYLSNTVPQSHNSYLETGKYPKHVHCAATPDVAEMYVLETPASDSSSLLSHTIELSVSRQTREQDGLKQTSELRRSLQRGILKEPHCSVQWIETPSTKESSNFLNRDHNRLLKTVDHAKSRKDSVLQQEQILPNDFPNDLGNSSGIIDPHLIFLDVQCKGPKSIRVNGRT
ncbi:5dfd7a0d-463d-4f25-82fe-144c889e528e [Sclerotinia trifoliorum]|uniref:5dfd7a0d-463d-4f25-82fe-144c889e528e n=1 Tax=Sclerotinia trifoliorum TaxID=28548 RepID=A0A8H2W086_9HELO|nr:5dfd7a0d-463d-4f25-82fe-144c889e528e [Sclerotinia trifoliorum]